VSAAWVWNFSEHIRVAAFRDFLSNRLDDVIVDEIFDAFLFAAGLDGFA